MGLLDTLRSGIKTADKILKPLQSTVSYQRVTARDAYGAPSTFASAVSLKAIVDFRAVPVRDKEGTVVYSSAVLTFLDPAAVVSVTNGDGVDTDDIFVLADGTTGKVLSIGGFMDPGTTKPIPLTVMLG
jgi:hypothetical protein